jgi:hypothetical protein
MKQAYLNAGVMDRLNSRTIDSPDSDGSLEADSYYDEDFSLNQVTAYQFNKLVCCHLIQYAVT